MQTLCRRCQGQLRSVARVVECPVGLASGRRAIAHKLHALMHSNRMCAKGWAQAVDLFNCAVAWATDLGTEKGFAL
eukprot:7163065-Alexandrium_andersonii.AAC.1